MPDYVNHKLLEKLKQPCPKQFLEPGYMFLSSETVSLMTAPYRRVGGGGVTMGMNAFAV